MTIKSRYAVITGHVVTVKGRLSNLTCDQVTKVLPQGPLFLLATFARDLAPNVAG